MTAVQPLAGFDERTLELSGQPGGGSLHYLVGGSGPPLLLVHGLGGSALNWVEVAPELAGRRRVLIPDLPGHGGSSALHHASSLDPYADALAELIVREQAAPVPVGGHSLGGLVAVRLAVRRPEVVSAILLAAAAGVSTTRRRIRYGLEVLGLLRPGRRLAPHRARIAASARLRAAVFGWWGAADPAALPAPAVDGFLAGWERHTDTLSAARAMVLDDVRADLGRVRCPCLVLWGARDNQVRIDDGFEYARRLGAPLRVIPDCGHLLIGERPDAVLDAIDALLVRSDRVRELDELPLESEAVG